MGEWRRWVAWGMVAGWLACPDTLFALSLDEAKAQGLVGEKRDGYLGLVDPANREARELVADINERRRQAYQEIARRDGTTLSVVESLAGEKAIKKTKPGHYVEGPAGWIKK